MKKQNSNQQISLDALRIKKLAISPDEIKRLKAQLREEGVKILKIKIKSASSADDKGGTD